MMDKIAFRKYFLEYRQKVDPLMRVSAATQAQWRLESSEIFAKSDLISSYMPINGEFNSIPLTELIWRAGKKCYLPVVSPDGGGHLIFIQYNQNDKLNLNRYKIPEPVSGASIPPKQLDMVLIPLLGFDEQGHRLGSGGGYYDRTFAFLRETPGHPLLIGVAFAGQKAECLPTDPWDVLLDGALTEEGLIFFKR